MKKRMISAILSTVMTVSALTGCAADNESAPSVISEVSSDSETSGEASSVSSSETSAETSGVSSGVSSGTSGVSSAASSTNVSSAESSSGNESEKPPETPNVPEKPNVESGSGFSETGSGYEGAEGRGAFNYGEALQKSLLFYELQRSGDLDESTLRTNWRGDSGLQDGADAGLDLTGGLYDAGDNVKFNLPMAYTATMLSWSIYEDRAAYEKSGQLKYALGNIKWICDYLIKCHPESDVFYYQVGDGNADHAWWGACEVMQMNRPSFKVDKNASGSTVAGEAAAALAACAAVYKNIDPAYAKKCLSHAKQLYDFAESTKSDAGYTAANGFYNSWSGFYDELAWAAVWLNIATGEGAWLDKAKEYITQCDLNTRWTLCWDNKSMGAVCLLAEITGDSAFKSTIEECLDWWCNGITYSPKGLAWLDTWGSLRYATTTAMLAASYSESGACSDEKAAKYMDFCEKQINYALGSSGRSFVVGFGENPPEHPHHRTAQGSWSDNMNEPGSHRHTLYGALVGGPDASDNYNDTVSDYTANEVACDYNAGFTGALAKMYKKYGGRILKDFGAVEPVGEELYAEYSLNASGNGFTEIKAVVYNKSAWCARAANNLELRYFVDLSELDGNFNAVNVAINYGEGAKFGGIYEWNKAKGIYYISIDFSDALIYPGGQSAYKSEVQFRMSANGWSAENDPSYIGLNGSALVRAENCGLYESGVPVYGTEPNGSFTGIVSEKPADKDKGESTVSQIPQTPQTPQAPPETSKPSSGKSGVELSLNQQQTSGNGATIFLTIELTNNSGADINLSRIKLGYFFTADGKSPVCECDYAGASGSNYAAITNYVKSGFESASGENRDTKCAISFTGGTLESGGTATLQLRIHTADWTDFNLGNDWSAGRADRVEITVG